MVGLIDFKDDIDVLKHMNQTGRKYVIFEASVYDVTEYIAMHPGGQDKIEQLIGKNIDKEYIEAGHSRSARNIFRDLDKVGVIYGTAGKEAANLNAANIKGLDGTLLESKIKLDYNKGIFWQLFLMKDLTWDDYI